MSTRVIRRQGGYRKELSNEKISPERRSWPQALTLLVAMVVTLAIALYLFVLPPVVPADAPAAEFSAERAMKDVRAIADEPHPMGSPEHEATADYIVGRLRELGLSPQVRERTSLRYNPGEQVHAGRVKNILARIPGTDNTGAILLVSHYDSMPTTPAAADGGVSTATMLETVRAIQAGPPLKNDVIVYFGDADVNGVIGATAFHYHPWSEDVGVGFAFEGIGSYGPSALVYEGQAVSHLGPGISTSPENPDLGAFPVARNGWWLGEALEVLPHPLVILPLNDSLALAGNASPELATLFMGTDAAGLGFGQFHGTDAYHTMLDNPQRLDPRSLQDQGSNALSLTRHFGNLPLDRAEQEAEPSLVAFNVLPGRVVSYPSTWALPLAAAIAAALVVLLVAGIRRGRLKVGGLLLGVVLFMLSLIGTAVVTALGWKLDAAINPTYQVWMGRGYYGADLHLLYLAALTVSFCVGLYLLARRFIRAARDDQGVAAGALVVLTLLAVLTGMGIPSLSYLFTWPTLAGMLVLGFAVLVPARAQGRWTRAVVLAVAAFVPIILFAPPIYSFYTLLAAPWTVAVTPVPLVIAALVLLALMMGVLMPHLYFLGGRRRWMVPVAFAAVAMVFLAGELITTQFDAGHPRPDYVQYRLDADTGKATWISDTNPPDAWTKQFFQGGYKRGEEAFAPVYNYGYEFEVIRAPAPEVDLPAPRLEVLSNITRGDIRTLRLRLISPRGAPYAHLETTLPGDLVEASLDNMKLAGTEIPTDQRRRFPLTFYNLPKGGVEIVLSVRSNGPINATLTDYSNGLPKVPGMEIEPRPPEFMPTPYDFHDPTVVSKSFEF